MDNETLKFALDVLSLHYSQYEVDCMNEIQKRITRGEWLDVDKSILAKADMPGWLYVWTFCLLWS
jgi:hypothetical protein